MHGITLHYILGLTITVNFTNVDTSYPVIMNELSNTSNTTDSDSEISQNETVRDNYTRFELASASNHSIILNNGEVIFQAAILVLTTVALVDFLLQTFLTLFVFALVRVTKNDAQELKIKNYWSYVLSRGIVAFLFISFRIVLLSTILFTLFAQMDVDLRLEFIVSSQSIDIAFYANLSLICAICGFSCVVCIYYLLKVGIRARASKVQQRRRQKITSGESDKFSRCPMPMPMPIPMVVILMPIYNETPEALFRAIESVLRCDYSPQMKHIFLSFDDDQESPLYLALLKKLSALHGRVIEDDNVAGKIKCIGDQHQQVNKKADNTIFPKRLEWIIEDIRVTVCRFPHEGKSSTQGKSYHMINELYGQLLEDRVLILFIDSDIVLHKNAIANFVTAALENPSMKGATGLVTCRTSHQFNLYQYLQDAEYIEGQMFVRTMEGTLGGVTCLPGALCLVPFSSLQKVASEYFAEFGRTRKTRAVDYHRFYLGEDRFMTFLLMELAEGPWEIKFVPSAQCKTDAPDSFQKLLKQRRRWFLGGLTNDVAMLASPSMWTKYPLVTLFKFYFYSVRGMDLVFWVLILNVIRQLSYNATALSSSSSSIILAVVILVFLFLKLLLVATSSIVLKRLKVAVSIIVLLIVAPLFNIIVMLYSVWTWDVRSWGGPRMETNNETINSLQTVTKTSGKPHHHERFCKKSLNQIKLAGRIIQSRLDMECKRAEENHA